MGARKFLTSILLPADPTVALEAATKQYVDYSSIPVFATTTARDAWTTAPNGAICTTLDTYTQWIKIAGTWVPSGGVTPGAYIYRSSVYGVPNATWTTIPFTTTAFNNMCTIGANSITVLHKGVYIITGQCWWAGGSAAGQWRAMKTITNGTWAVGQSVTQPSQQGPYQDVTAVVALSPNDVVTMQAYQDWGNTMNVVGSNGATEIGTSLYVQWVSARV